MPQVYSCGMSERLDRFNYVGDLQKAANHSKELLGHVGLWDSHGAHFIGGGVNADWHSYCHLASHPANHTGEVGFQQKGSAGGEYSHSKNSVGKMKEFYTPKLLRKVREEMYPDDQRLWSAVAASGNRLSVGKELASKLSSRCADLASDATII